MADINEKTRVPLFAVAMTIPIIFGGIVWLTAIDAKASSAQDELSRTRAILEHYQNRLDSIDQRLSHIEGHLNQ